MSSIFGKKLTIAIFGQSHSPAIGVSIDGLPAGYRVDTDELASFMKRRAPGESDLSTQRKETDTPEILAGLSDGVTCGAPMAILIRNNNAKSGDYEKLRDVPRPSHADFAAYVKYNGYHDVYGGGHFSGRLTAPLCAAGGICLQILRSYLHVDIGAHILSIGGVYDEVFDPLFVSRNDFIKARENPLLPTLSNDSASKMRDVIIRAKSAKDSVGGIVECAATGVPAGLGDPMFDGMENRLSAVVFGIPAVKGIEFGKGFVSAGILGSENNDEFFLDKESRVMTRTNNCGGILGGITNGMPIVFRAAFKPTPSISAEQNSVDLLLKENVKLTVKGRHDPCIVPRAVPCVEAAAAVAILDASLYAGII